MAQQPIASAPARKFGLRSIGWSLLVVVSFGLLALLILSEVIRFSTPPPLHRLQVVQDIPLPGALPDANRTQNPLAPGKAERFDHFDFQAFDPQTHLLFMVHTGPNPDKQHAVDRNFDPDKGALTDGNIVVFDTQQNKVVGLINVAQATGIVAAPDLGRVYVGDAPHGVIAVIDEKTLKIIANIQLDQFDNSDDIEYDQLDHRIFVGNPGVSAMPDKTTNIALRNQNVAVIDAITNKLIAKLPIGVHPPFGDDVGHLQFDPVLRRLFVVTLPLHDQDTPIVDVTPPSFLDVVDPNTLRVLSQIKLPDACVGPHGLIIDAQQHVAFIACVETQNLVRIDLQTMQPFPDVSLMPLAFSPDIVRLDNTSHLLFVGCKGGISVFDESGRQLKKLGDYFVGGDSNHTVAINEAAHIVYVPLASVGGRPVLRVVRYVVNCPQCA